MAKSLSKEGIRTVLVPVDYSDVSLNALEYAMRLAAHLKASIALLHIYSLPLPEADTSIVQLATQLEEEHQAKLEKLRQHVLTRTKGAIPVSAHCRMGFIIREEICHEITLRHADLVVMGITGAGNLTRTFIGSNTTSLLKKTKCPVLIIPAKARFKAFHSVVFALDEGKSLPRKFAKTLHHFIHAFNSRLFVLNVQKPMTAVIAGTAELLPEKIVRSLHIYHPEYYFPIGDSFENELEAFLKTHKPALLVMVPHIRNKLSGLFHKSNTKTMAFHTHIPLLSIHE